MTDFLGVWATSTLTIVIIAGLASAARSTGAALVAIVVAALWAGFAMAAGGAGWLANPDFAIGRLPAIGIFVAAPLLLAALAAFVPALRLTVLAAPLWLLVGLHAGRLLGALFLVLETEGRLAGLFPFFAGWGDIIAGVVAVPLAWSLRHVDQPRGALAALVWIWSLFGALDLINALFLGVTSSPGGPLQLFDTAPGSEAMQYAPFSTIPTVLVPFYLTLHAIVFAKLSTKSAPAGG